ncbi:MAG: VWA domain-containing protein [Oscillospiraceae bacterium]|nr:VWA domain-containing protein [Oscillospiraceae bacterium]
MKNLKIFTVTVVLLLSLIMTACNNEDYTRGGAKNAEQEVPYAGEHNDEPANNDRRDMDAGNNDAVNDYEYEYDDAVEYHVAENVDADVDGEYNGERADRKPGHIMGGKQVQIPEYSAGTLTAGEWRDNHNWGEFVDLFETGQFSKSSVWGNMLSRWQLYPTERIEVCVTRSGTPLRNVKVELINVTEGQRGSRSETLLWSARTDHNGTAYLFGEQKSQNRASKDYIRVNSGSLIEVDSDFIEVNISNPAPRTPQKSLDLMLVFDTTGSMGDELKYLQVELEDVINEVRRENSNISTRLSVNFYRDSGDEYVILPYEFTTDIRKAIRVLGEQSASGGGDWPEALDEALFNAVYEHDWNNDSVKIMLLVTDAPAHNNRRVIESLKATLAEAANAGIRIVPVMASGNGSSYDLDTEFLLRTFAIMTGGVFTFLTDHSGVGNPHAEPEIDSYRVQMLNEMLINIINDYIF